ncbi:RAD9, HUS1, RAD1-interacting nuclear orphan protein 1 [Rhinophrynus dorsalis]
MPRRKQATCNPRRSRLVFLESPKQGPHHEYGSPPQKTEPTCVPTRPLDHNVSTSWVSPQFEQTGELHFPARRRLRHASVNSTAQSRTRNASRSELTAAGRKPSVCKFPSLSFSAGMTEGSTKTEALFARKRRALPSHKKEGRTVPTSPPLQNLCSQATSPPDLRTPEISPQCNRSTLLVHEMPESRTPNSRGKDERLDGLDTPLIGGPGQVLAEDTPEQEYGIRVTWRRRQQLMRQLKARGRLKSSQIVVKI